MFKRHVTDLKKSDIWKIQLTIAINFTFLNNNDEECVMHSKSDNTEIMINDKIVEIMEKRF